MKTTFKPAIVTAICALFLVACTLVQASNTPDASAASADVEVSYLPMDGYNF